MITWRARTHQQCDSALSVIGSSAIEMPATQCRARLAICHRPLAGAHPRSRIQGTQNTGKHLPVPARKAPRSARFQQAAPKGSTTHRTGGSRAIAAASDHDAARPVLQSASVLPNR